MNGYKGVSEDDFIKRIKESDLEVVGLTNYFCFRDEDFALKTKLERNGIVTFLNLEVRLDYQNKEDLCCDLHIIFDNKLEKEMIQRFLANLNIKVGAGEKKAAELSGGNDYLKGVVHFNHLVKTLDQKSLGLKERYLIGFLSRGHGTARSSSSYAHIEEESHLLVHSSKAQRKIKDDREYWLKKGKPLVQTSDAHRISDIGNKYTWIKADPTYDGLKQIIYEPSERLKIQERNPSDPKAKRLIVESASYRTSTGEEKIVRFNKDLNSIIGKRGSGKSTLLKNLAQNIDLVEFEKRGPKKLYHLDDFKVTWEDGQINGGTEDSPKSVFYIPQGYLSALAYDDGERASERDDFLTGLLKKNDRFANAVLAFENFVSNNKVYIQELIQKLLSTNRLIRENEMTLKKQGAKTEIELEIKHKNEQIKEYKGTDITDEEIEKYAQSGKVVEQGKKTVDILSQDRSILFGIRDTGARVSVSEQEFNLLSPTRKELIQKVLQEKSNESLKTLIDEEMRTIDEQIKNNKNLIVFHENIIQQLGEKIKQSKTLEDLTKELADLGKTVETIKKLSSELEKAKKERNDTIDALASAYSNFETQQDLIYKTINFEDTFSFLKVEVVARYDTQKLKDFVGRNINTRDSYHNIKSYENVKILFGASPKKLTTDTIKTLIVGLIDGLITVKVEAGDLATVIAQLLDNPFEIDYLNSVKTENGATHFKDMTGGQKAIALLELIFSFDDKKYPILIDQPEDDLDVGGIAGDLVKFIMAEKQDRQIIVVTHNASLVICADTENVITSRINNVKSGIYDFSYATGSIENPDRRGDIVQVLEGGESALKKRMLKLNIG